MTFPDRDRLREALAASDEFNGEESWEHYVTIREAARLVASETTLIVEKVNGEWPEWVDSIWIDDGIEVIPALDALLAQQQEDTK